MNIIDFSALLLVNKSEKQKPRRSSSVTALKKATHPLYELMNNKKITLIHHKQLQTFTYSSITHKTYKIATPLLEKVYEHKQCEIILHNWQVASLKSLIKDVGYQLIEKGMIIHFKSKQQGKNKQKNITYVTELKETIMDLCRPQAIAISFQNCHIIFSIVNHHSEVKLTTCKVVLLATYIQEPSKQNETKSITILEQSLKIRQSIEERIRSKKSSFCSRDSQILSEESLPTRKNSMKKKKKKLPTESSSEEEFSPKIKDEKIKQKQLSAENIHLRWVINTMQESFKKQSQQYILTMKDKILQLRQERKVVLSENIDMKKSNQSLQIEVVRLQRLNQQLSSRTKQLQSDTSSIVEVMEENRKYKAQVHQLRQKNNNQHSNFSSLQEEIQEYKNVCSEMKTAFQELTEQYMMEKNRNKHLQRRIKQYEHSMQEIINIPMRKK